MEEKIMRTKLHTCTKCKISAIGVLRHTVRYCVVFVVSDGHRVDNRTNGKAGICVDGAGCHCVKTQAYEQSINHK